MFSDAASKPTKFDMADWRTYDTALEEIGDAMRKLMKPDNDVKDMAHQGRQLCETASLFLLAVRQAQPLPDRKADLTRDLKHLSKRAKRGEDPPPGFQGLDPFHVDPAISTSHGAWRSMLRAMKLLRDLGHKGSHRGAALKPSDRSTIGDAAYEVAHAVTEVTRIYYFEQAQQHRPIPAIAENGWFDRLNTIERLLGTSCGLRSVGAELTEAGEAMSTLKDAPVAPATGAVVKWMAMNAKAKALTEQLEGDLESALGLSPPATAHDLAPLVELIRVEDAATAQAAIDAGCLPPPLIDGAAIRQNVLAAEALDHLFSDAVIGRREPLAEMNAAMAQAAIDAGCLPPLIANLRRQCTDVAVAAARCLSALTDDASFRAAFKAAGGMRALLDLLATRTGGHVLDKTSGLLVKGDDGEPLVLASDADPRMPANAWLLEAPPCAWGTDGFGPVALFVARLGRADAEFYDAMVASGVIASIVAMVRGGRGDGGKSEEPWWAATALERLVVHQYSGEPCPPPHLNLAAFSAAQTIVASGGGEALIFLARHGDLAAAHAATNVLQRLVELGYIEAPSPWPMRRDGGGRVLNPWMEPARRRKMYGGEGSAVGDGAGASGELPAWALCPISLAPMLDAVMTSDGYTYERSAVSRWFKQQRSSPMTGAPLADTRLTPNFLVRSLVSELVHARERA